MGMSLAHGGHLTHGSPVNNSGKLYNFVHYEVDEEGFIQYDDIAAKLREHNPKLVVAGASSYSRIIDFARIRSIIDEYTAETGNTVFFMADIAHIAGLVVAGVHPTPFGVCDVVTLTTHKTLRGARGGLTFAKKEYAKKIDSAAFPGTQGGPLMHIIAAKAVCFGEAMKPEFKEYQQKVAENAKALEYFYLYRLSCHLLQFFQILSLILYLYNQRPVLDDI